MMENTNFCNNFLIAMPALNDPNFSQAVVYICEHNDNGAIGIIINRPTSITVSDIWTDLKITPLSTESADLPILFGGPMHQEHGFVIHRSNRLWRSTLETSDELAVTSSRDILEALAQGAEVHDILVSLGYAGWGAGQLEEEIAKNAWLTCPADPNILFSTPFDARWDAAVNLLGIESYRLSGDVGHA